MNQTKTLRARIGPDNARAVETLFRQHCDVTVMFHLIVKEYFVGESGAMILWNRAAGSPCGVVAQGRDWHELEADAQENPHPQEVVDAANGVPA